MLRDHVDSEEDGGPGAEVEEDFHSKGAPPTFGHIFPMQRTRG